MEPRIEILEAKKLVGLRAEMSLAEDRTPQLWRAFMPRRSEIPNRVSTDYMSMRLVSETDPGKLFSPNARFEKWAVVEVADHASIPEGMEGYSLAGGSYAVFLHQGPMSSFPATVQLIFGSWLPGSEFGLDCREQFELLAEGYDPQDPEAREEVWIPIRRREDRGSP